MKSCANQNLQSQSLQDYPGEKNQEKQEKDQADQQEVQTAEVKEESIRGLTKIAIQISKRILKDYANQQEVIQNLQSNIKQLPSNIDSSEINAHISQNYMKTLEKILLKIKDEKDNLQKQ